MSTRRALGRPALLLVIVCAVVAGGLLLWRPWRSESPRRAPVLTAPFAIGTSAGNIPLVGAGTRVMVRWVARSSGTLAALHLRVQADGSKCRHSARTGYGLGDGGSWYVTTHSVLADGRPDTTRTLARQELRPCDVPKSLADPRQGVLRLPMRLEVTRGREYATVIRNDDPEPGLNWTSINCLYMDGGLAGANARNERSKTARDVYYGLDPRELVGYSKDGGKTWMLPGGPYGTPPLHRNFLPAYIQEYSDGRVEGQPYYYAAPHSKAKRTMVFQNRHGEWTIRALGVFISYPSRGGTLTLEVDGRTRARVAVGGKGLKRVPIPPVTVPIGKTATVTASGLWIRDVVADSAWGHVMRFDTPSAPWKLEGSDNFSAAAPVYPLPAPPA